MVHPVKPQQTYYVVLPRQSEEVLSRARPISRLLRKEEHETARLLRHPTFQVVLRFAKRPNAEGFRNQFHALGGESFIVSDHDIASALFLYAATANQGQGGLAFVDFTDQPLFCPFGDILAVCAGPVLRRDGTETLLIDLHRRSTPITPRLDTAHFDFGALTGTPGDDAYAWLDSLRDKLQDVDFDLDFAEVVEAIAPAVQRGLARFPGEVQPPPEKLQSPYEKASVRMFSVYSFFSRLRRVVP